METHRVVLFPLETLYKSQADPRVRAVKRTAINLERVTPPS